MHQYGLKTDNKSQPGTNHTINVSGIFFPSKDKRKKKKLINTYEASPAGDFMIASD